MGNCNDRKTRFFLCRNVILELVLNYPAGDDFSAWSSARGHPCSQPFLGRRGMPAIWGEWDPSRHFRRWSSTQGRCLGDDRRKGLLLLPEGRPHPKVVPDVEAEGWLIPCGDCPVGFGEGG